MLERQVCKMGENKKTTFEGMDRLGTMFARQAKFAERFFNVGKMTQVEREQWVKEMCLCDVSETMELLDEVNWKHWKKTRKDVDIEQARFEVADKVCFLLNIAMLLGMDAESVFQYFMCKVQINFERQARCY
jgi:NTP pyrophosphatase (non-canonical NTP hydrolase)